MKILIVEDSLGLINIYEKIIKHVINEELPKEEIEITSVVNYNEYKYFKDNKFDLAIFDWNINGGTSRKIVEDVVGKLKYSIFITAYAYNKEVNLLSTKYKIPILPKPTNENEISDLLRKVINSIKDDVKEQMVELI